MHMSTSSGTRRSTRLATKEASTSKSPPRRTKSSTSKNPPRRPTTKSSTSEKQPRRLPAKKGQPEFVYLRVNRRFLYQITAPTADQPNPDPLPPPPGTTGHLTVIRASLQDLRPFAGNTVDWLIHVARLIFEPLGTSSLFTFTTNTLESWLDRDMDPSWREVEPGDQLRATIYEFCPNNDAFILISKISLREVRSVTTKTSQPQGTEFCNALLQRDNACVISSIVFHDLLIASHLVPRRLGDAGVQHVVQRFTGLNTVVDRYDPTIGVLLYQALDGLADRYLLGFWNREPDQYVVHNFYHARLNMQGAPSRAGRLHGHLITLSNHGGSPLPPVGVFNWHYLQCVLQKFATPEYGEIPNIHHFSLPFRTRDDESDDCDFDDERNIADPPYPSYLVDLAGVRAQQRLEDAERNRAIVAWNSGVSVEK